MTLVGDLEVTGRIDVDSEHAAGLGDGQALAGTPAQRAQHDAIGNAASVIDCGQTVNQARGPDRDQQRKGQRTAGQGDTDDSATNGTGKYSRHNRADNGCDHRDHPRHAERWSSALEHGYVR